MAIRPASTFVILGMHRSGTSALTRAVNLLGPRTSDNIMKANHFNATGYWEPQAIVRFNDNVISSFDRHWADPKPFSNDWVGSDKFRRCAENAAKLLNDEFGQSGSIAVKDPRFSRLLPIWRYAFAARKAEPVYLISCRNPLEVAQSLATRDKLSIEHGLNLWLSYMLEAEIGTRGLRREVVQYGDLLSDWRNAFKPICQYGGLPELKKADERLLQSVDDFLVDGARHYAVTKSQLDADPEVPEIIKRAYELFLHFSENQNREAFDQLYADWRTYWRQNSPGNFRSACVDQIPQVQLENSRALEGKGLLDEALTLAKSAAETASDVPRFRFRVGDLLEKTGDLAGAAVAMRRALTLDDKPAEFHLGLARVLRKQGNLEDATAILQSARLSHPDNARIHSILGDLLENTGDLAEAAVAKRRALTLDDKPAEFHLGLARVLRKQGKLEDAAAVLQSARLLHPDNARIHSILGICLEKIGNFDDAIVAMRQAIILDDEQVEFHLGLARVLRSKGQLSEVVTTLQAARSRHPDNAFLHNQYGTFLELTGDLAEGAKAHDKAHQLDMDVVDSLVEKASISTLLGDKDHASTNIRIGLAQKQAFIRLLSWQASKCLADDASKMNSKGALEYSPDKVWPMGKSRPKELVNPKILPVESAIRPQLSIMIPTYEVRSEKWLRECIESVLAQDLDWDQVEIVVIDDCSSSETARTLAQSYGSRVKYSRNSTRLGLAGNFNRCIETSRGTFVHILHHDDQILSGFYEALLQPMLEDDSVVAAFSNTMLTDDEGRVKGVSPNFSVDTVEAGLLNNWLETIGLRQRILCPSIIVRRSAYEAVGGFSPSLAFSLDWDMWTRLAALGPVWSDPQPLAYFRQHSGSETSRQHPLHRAIDCMHTTLRNSQVLPKETRQPIIRATCRYFLESAGNFITSSSGQKSPKNTKEQTLHLLLRGQTNQKYIALASALLEP